MLFFQFVVIILYEATLLFVKDDDNIVRILKRSITHNKGLDADGLQIFTLFKANK